MKTSLGSRSLAQFTFASVVVASFAIGAVACAAPPVQNDLGDDNTTTKDPKDNSSALPNNTKSDNNAPTPTPTPTPAPTPAPTTTTPPPVTPPVDPNANACPNLTTCCQQLTDSYASLACMAATFANKEDICAKGLIACKVDVALGGLGGGGGGAPPGDQFCEDDFDCPGDQLCDDNLCHD